MPQRETTHSSQDKRVSLKTSTVTVNFFAPLREKTRLKPKPMHENNISKIIVDVCFQIHKELGPGLLESIYEEILYQELKNEGMFVERQKSLPVIWRGKSLNLVYRTDLIVERKVIIEIKSVQEIHHVHPKQLLTYLKLSNLKLGLLINFNSPLMKTGITRIVNNL